MTGHRRRDGMRARAMLAIAALLAAGVWAASGLRLGSDLARFMPAPENADETLLIGELGAGPASRLLLLAIAHDEAAQAAQLSRALRERLSASGLFDRVLNGEIDEVAELETLLPLRFTHSPGMDRARFDTDGLAEALRERLADLGGAGGEAFETLLAHDPQLLTLAMAEAWQPARMPALREGVWFSAQGEALLLAQTHAAGFDPQAQAQALATVEREFAALPAASSARLVVSGAGSFSARMSERVRGEAGLLGGIAVTVLVLLVLAAYRSPIYVLLSALPLACAAAAGVIALRLGFGEAHGITLAFAFTLIGVAQDYPVHLLSHARPGADTVAVARSLWPALRLGVASTVIAYLTLFSAAAEGLAQLAVFTIAGLLTAGLITRFALPALVPATRRDVLSGRWFPALAARLERARTGMWLALPVLALLALALWLGHGRPWWNDDLSSLTPLPPAWLEEDARLRAELATPDARHLLVLSGEDTEAVLRLSERLAPRFAALIAAGTLADHGLPSRYRPSAEIQRWRLARLPAPELLRAALADAADATGFDAAYFEPMVEDVHAARAPDFPARLAEAFAASPAGDRLAASLRESANGAYALVELSGLSDAAAVRAAIADQPQARLLDLKAAAEGMVIAFRERVLLGLAAAAAALLLLVVVAFGPRRAARVLPPVVLGIAATLAILRLLGVELTLFHLIALMLAAGLGMDYALFFVHAGAGDEQRRTLHAVLLSAASTLLVFGLLAVSEIPVLHAIGLSVAIGVSAQFVLALLLARADRPPSGAPGHA